MAKEQENKLPEDSSEIKSNENIENISESSKEKIPDSDTNDSSSNTPEENNEGKFDGFLGGFKEHVHELKTELSEQSKEIWNDYKEESRHKKIKRQKEFYGGNPPKTKKLRALYIAYQTFKRIVSLVLTAVFSLMLIFILTGTIVGTSVIVYILNFMDTTPSVVLGDIEESFSSYIYMINKETEEYELVYKVTPPSHDVRIASDVNELPDHVKYAFVCIEDERFYSHEGVDYKRTGAAVANLMLQKIGISSRKFGGSTITQQLIKNVTGDNEDSWERKMREIFTAMKFEKNYTKDEILEAYLNEIYFDEIDSYHMYGIEAASIGYFGKSATELTIAEAATLAAIPKSPYDFNPTKFYEDNKERKEYCLYKMFELGVISADQYEEAMNEEILVSTMDKFKKKYPNAKKLTESDDDFENPEINSWSVDTAIYEFADYLVETNNLDSRREGISKFNSGGYKVYITADADIQAHLDETFEDWYYFPEYLSDADYLSDDERRVQAALAVMDYKGNILGVAGHIGKKEGNLGWNNAYQTHRQPGSAIKPVSTYGYALENDLITWSTYFYDRSLPAGVADPNDTWPNNYDGAPSGGYYPVNYFLKQSINTLPAQIAWKYGVDEVFDFATQKMHLDLDPVKDRNYSPICVGGTSTGPTVINLANAYIPYGNGGTYYKASIISKVVDLKTGELIIDNQNKAGEPAVGEDTAYIMNKLLQRVIKAGTGTAAQLGGTIVAGKTGTTENWRDITFVGLTPDYVSALWVGYPEGENPGAIRNSNSAKIWYNVWGTYASEHAVAEDFPDCETVLKNVRYCSYTGLIANSNCPGGDYGYYKQTDSYCYYH